MTDLKVIQHKRKETNGKLRSFHSKAYMKVSVIKKLFSMTQHLQMYVNQLFET
jgi:hypothetical protein